MTSASDIQRCRLNKKIEAHRRCAMVVIGLEQ
jgi:hypothetical protein